MNSIYLIFILLFFITISVPAYPQTITEKKAGISTQSQDMTPEMQKTLVEVNKELKEAQSTLKGLYAQVNELFVKKAPKDRFQLLLEEINRSRKHEIALEEHWREMAVEGATGESYALWQQSETTIGQLVMDYGSQGYVYLIPEEIDNIRLSVNSSLPIPRASWEEMLELILLQNGIGYKQLNPFLRQLFFLKDNPSGLKLITNKRQDLDFFSSDTRVCFVLTPEPAEARRAWLFLDKFINPNTTTLQMLGRDILIIGQASELKDLLKLYDFIAANKGEKEYKIFAIRRIEAEEMARILAAMFDQSPGNEEPFKASPVPFQQPKKNGLMGATRERPPIKQPLPFLEKPKSDMSNPNGIKVIPLANIANALFVVGTKEELHKAEQIITRVEGQLGDARERIIHWYVTKHSDPEELAEILQKIYSLIIQTTRSKKDEKEMEGQPHEMFPLPTSESIADEIISKELAMLPSELYQTSYYQQGNYIVNPSPVEPRRTQTTVANQNRDNFIVDLKTGSIAMVIEADYLQQMKDLIKRLDVAKRMVQIEVLLFERRILKQNNFGLNLLKIGDCASQANSSCTTWNDVGTSPLFAGVLNFFFSRGKTCSLPAYDIAYRFLMTQDDIQINASPSVLAMNQTPANISIVEEISINTGIYNVNTVGGVTQEKAFTRAQYGITINMTPTIHMTNEEGEESEEPNYVTLDTDITFDDVRGGLSPERPDVIRRHIENEVRVPDGQTIIIGGLRRKNTDDSKESIPFLGELPAIGKFFSKRELSDNETEMFIFLTPTIISDPLDQLERIKCEEMRRRPGDIPEFLCSLVRAREMEKNRVLANSMVILLDNEPDRCYSPGYWRPSTCGNGSALDAQVCLEYLPLSGEYDGR